MTDLLAVDLLPDGLGVATLLLVLLAGLTAGFVDAVVGGGGLVQLPALLLVPGISPVEALATNKLGSVFGTTTSAVTSVRAGRWARGHLGTGRLPRRTGTATGAGRADR